MNDPTPIPALVGGALIGLSASLLLLTHGRVAGVSSLYGGILRRGATDRATAIAFVAGLLSAGLVARFVFPAAFDTAWTPALPVSLVAGLLVGFGTQLGSGCTSGHGVCGISRLSPRSIMATGTFMIVAIASVFVVRHVVGASR